MKLPAMDPDRELRDWYFDHNHQLVGYIVYDKTGFFDPGAFHPVPQIRSVSEYPRHFIVKNTFATYYLDKDKENVSSRMRVDPTPAYIKLVVIK